MDRSRGARRTAVVGTIIITSLGAGIRVPDAAAYQAEPWVASVAESPIADPTHSDVHLIERGVDEPTPLEAGTIVSRSSHSRTAANGDGSLTATYSSRPMHWLKEGGWEEFDNRLVPALDIADVAWTKPTGPFRADFGTALAVELQKPAVRIEAGGRSFTVTPIEARPAVAKLGERSVTYVGAWADADLRYIVDNERIKEDIILHDAPATAPRYEFRIDLDGLQFAQAKDGRWVFTSADGAEAFELLPMVMVDSAVIPETAPVQFAATQVDGGVLITIEPDLRWLADPSRVYPVAIDPTFGSVLIRPSQLRTENAGVKETAAASNFYAAPTMAIGRTSSGLRYDSLIGFPSLVNFPADAVVTDAELEVEASSGVTILTQTNRNDGAWDDGSVTWNTAPTIGSYVSTTILEAGTDTDIPVTNTIRDIIRGFAPNDGVRIQSAGANGKTINIHSSWSTCETCRPELQITYVPATRYGHRSMWTQTTTAYGGGNSAAVEVSTGNLAFTHAGGTVPARGFNVDLTHTYNSGSRYGEAPVEGGFYGVGWTFGWNFRLFTAGSAVVLQDGSGDESRVFTYASPAGGINSYSAPSYYGYHLIKDTSSPPPDRVYTLTADVGGAQYFFDDQGKLTRVEDRNANFLTFGYDTSQRLVSITDVAARTTTLSYAGSPSRLSQITDMAGRVSSYAYDGNGDLTSISHGVGTADQVTTAFGYDDAHRLITVTNPRGQTSEIRYTAFNRWETAGNTDGWVANGGDPVLNQTTTRAHSGTGSLKVDLTAVGITVESVRRSYSPAQALSASSQQAAVWVYVSASSGLRAQLTAEYIDFTQTASAWKLLQAGWNRVEMLGPLDALGQVRHFEINFQKIIGTFTGTVYVDDLALRGQVASLSDAKPTPNTVVTYAYTPETQESVVSRPNSSGVFQPTTYAYDRLGTVSSVTDPIGNTSSTARDEQLNITSVTPPGVGAVPYQFAYYPNSAQLQSATNGAGEVSRRGADTANGDTRYTLDPLNEALSAGGTSAFDATVISRDATGNVLAAITSSYDAGADLEDDPFPAAASEHRRVEFTYTTGGLLDVMTDPLGNETRFDYDIATGYLTEISSEPGDGESTRRVTTFTRTADGSVDTMTDPAGQDTEFAYDSLGRLTDITYGVGEADEFTVSYTLDDNGNLTAMSDAAGSSTFTYDENNRVTAESRTQNAVTKSAAYAYFANGSMQTLTTFATQSVTFAYDNALRLTSQTDPNKNNQAITFGYDDRSRRTTITYPSGVTHSQTYDAGDRIASITLEQANGTDLQTFSYDYGFDGSGNRTADYAFGFVTGVSELDGSAVTYEYDALARLVAAERTGTGAYDQSYTYDAANNRLTLSEGSSTTTFSYDDANQLIGDGSITFDYDRNGNLTRAGTDDLVYDPANDWVDGDINGIDLAYSYDGLGRQVSRTQGSSSRTDLWFDQSGMTLESGQSNLTYLRDPAGLPLSVTTGSTVRNYGRDRLGSITGLTNNSETLQRTYVYDPYGSIVAQSGSQPNSLKFSAGRQDPSSTWYTLGQRTYAPELGRFTTQDPLPESVTDLNRHAYAGCNPANFVDPTGTSHCTLGQTAGAGVGTATGVIGIFGSLLFAPASLGLTIFFTGAAFTGYTFSLYALTECLLR